jgi:phage gp29-like protein
MALYDAFGREVDVAALKREQAGATTSGIRNVYSTMHPSAGLTPERLAEILQAAEAGDPYQYLELAEEMEEKDLHYLAVLTTRRQSVAELEPLVEPASDDADDIRAAALAQELLLQGGLSMEAALFDLLDAVGKGFAVTEIMWDTSGREWAPTGLKWRDPRWFVFDWVTGDEVRVRCMREEAGDGPAARSGAHFKGGMYGRARRGRDAQPMSEPLSAFKFAVHVAKAKSGLPVRGGIARAAGWAYLFKNYMLKDWVTFAEVFGQPVRIGKYQAGATETDKRTLLRAVANIGTDAAAIIPESMMIEFIQAQRGASPELYQRFCEYMDAQVSKAVLGQTLTTELARGAGSRAAAEVHNTVRRDIMAADARRLAATVTRDLVRPIVDLNLGPRRRYPKFVLRLPESEDVRTFAEVVAMLADRGLRVSQRTVLNRLGLAVAAEDEAVLAGSRGATANDMN